MARSTFLEAAPFLLVDDVVKSGEYWRDVLGFNLGRYFGEPPGFVIMQRNTARVMLRQAPSPAAVTNTAKLHEALDLYVWVSDVVSLYEELQERGAEIVNPPEIEDGRYEMLVREMNGYLICFGEVPGWPY